MYWFLTVLGAMITVLCAAVGAAFRKGRGWRYVNVLDDRGSNSSASSCGPLPSAAAASGCSPGY